jgi:effector-binding domain-containing protein
LFFDTNLCAAAMPAFQVQRSIVIHAPVEQVFDTLADFNRWSAWAPWLRIDEQALVTVSDDPGSVNSVYAWHSDLVGAGEIEHKRLDRPRRIDEELRIFKPFKSTSDVAFHLERSGGDTKITWHMKGSVPWFMFWMLDKMETFIGMDYERGLRMLREYAETGHVLSQTDVKGKERVEPMVVLGVRGACPSAEIGPAMEQAIASAKSILGNNGLPTDGEMISVYHPGDFAKGFDFTTGFVVDADAQTPPGTNRCELPGGVSLHVRHTGRYEHLGNAWSGAYQYARNKKLKIARRDGYEIYRNDPEGIPPSDWITDVYLPLRA